MQNGNCVQGLRRVVVLHSGSLQDGAQTPPVLQPSTIRALISPKPFAELCHSHSLSPPSLNNATDHVAPRTPAWSSVSLSPSVRSPTTISAGDAVYLGGLWQGKGSPGLRAGSVEEPAPALVGRREPDQLHSRARDAL